MVPRRSYIDETEGEAAGVPCVPIIEYDCLQEGTPEELKEELRLMLQHFRRYRSVWNQLGRRLTIDTGGHPWLEAHLAQDEVSLARQEVGGWGCC